MNVLAELWVTVRDLISNKPMDLHMREHTQSTPGSAIRTALSSSPNHMALIVHSSPGSFASWFLVWVVFIDTSVQKQTPAESLLEMQNGGSAPGTLQGDTVLGNLLISIPKRVLHTGH